MDWKRADIILAQYGYIYWLNIGTYIHTDFRIPLYIDIQNSMISWIDWNLLYLKDKRTAEYIYVYNSFHRLPKYPYLLYP